MTRLFALKGVRIKRSSIEYQIFAADRIEVASVKCEQRLRDFLDSYLIATGAKAALSTVNMTKLRKFLFDPVLFRIIRVLIPSHDLVLGIIKFNNIVDRLWVRTFDYTAKDLDIAKIVPAAVNRPNRTGCLSPIYD